MLLFTEIISIILIYNVCKFLYRLKKYSNLLAEQKELMNSQNSIEDDFNNIISNKPNITLETLHHLSPKEFEVWCSVFLKKLGYSNIELTNLGPDGGKDIICKKDNEVVYVECKRYAYDLDAKHIVNKFIVKKLVGVMIGDDIKNGVIITTGIVDKEAVTFARELPSDMTIKLIDGKEIIAIWESYTKPTPEFEYSFEH